MVAVHTVNTMSLEHSAVPCMFLLIEGSVYISIFCYLSQLTIMKQLTVDIVYEHHMLAVTANCNEAVDSKHFIFLVCGSVW